MFHLHKKARLERRARLSERPGAPGRVNFKKPAHVAESFDDVRARILGQADWSALPALHADMARVRQDRVAHCTGRPPMT